MFRLLGYLTSAIIFMAIGFCACKFGWYKDALEIVKEWISSKI